LSTSFSSVTVSSASRTPAIACFEHRSRQVLDEQRDAAGAHGDALERVGGKRRALGNGADHLAQLLTIQRNRRNDPMMRARHPRRAKLDPAEGPAQKTAEESHA
jgi:hypothetical protein